MPPQGEQPDAAHHYPLARFPGATFRSGDTLTFRVRSTFGKAVSGWSESTEKSRVALPRIDPVGINVAQSDAALIVHWQAGSGDRREYEIRVHDGADRPLAVQPTVEISQQERAARISGAALTPSSIYIVGRPCDRSADRVGLGRSRAGHVRGG